MSSCCETGYPQTNAPWYARVDWLLLAPLTIIVASLLLAGWQPGWVLTVAPVHRFVHGLVEFANAMWLSLVLAVVAMGALNFVPGHWFQIILGKGGTVSGVARAMVAGLLLDLCSHGILMVGAKLYKQGASLGQLIAFLVTSPWNSFSMMLLLAALVGWQWVGIFIVASAAVGFIAGVLADTLFNSWAIQIPGNGADSDHADEADDKQLSGWQTFWQGMQESTMVLRWVLLGLVLAAGVRAVFSPEVFSATFAPTVQGLGLTMLATSIIEVCSEGSIPIAADLLSRANAPGNAFAFLMAGVATDMTEILVLKDITGRWKTALLLPLLTVPFVLLFGWVLNGWAL